MYQSKYRNLILQETEQYYRGMVEDYAEEMIGVAKKVLAKIDFPRGRRKI